MTVTAPPARQILTSNLLAMFRAAAADGGLGIRVGDNRAPKFGGSPARTQPDPAADYPYGILYDIPGGARDGDYEDYSKDATFVYQFSAIGLRRDQAQLIGDRAGTIVCGRTNGQYTSPLTAPAGLTVMSRELDLPAGIQQQGTAEQLVWLNPVVFRIYVTSA